MEKQNYLLDEYPGIFLPHRNNPLKYIAIYIIC